MITTINEFRNINEKKSPDPKNKHFDPKDKKRIEDIITKSDKSAKKKEGNFSAVKDDNAKIKKEEETKAQQMANSITGFAKLMRRGNAAKALGKDKIANIFFKKAKLLKESFTVNLTRKQIVAFIVKNYTYIPENNDAYIEVDALEDLPKYLKNWDDEDLEILYDDVIENMQDAGVLESILLKESLLIEVPEFTQACERYEFYKAFEIAQEEGLFGEDFDEYIESIKRSGSGYDKMIQIYTEYQKNASQLKDLILSDIESLSTYKYTEKFNINADDKSSTVKGSIEFVKKRIAELKKRINAKKDTEENLKHYAIRLKDDEEYLKKLTK